EGLGQGDTAEEDQGEGTPELLQHLCAPCAFRTAGPARPIAGGPLPGLFCSFRRRNEASSPRSDVLPLALAPAAAVVDLRDLAVFHFDAADHALEPAIGAF